MMKNIFMVFFTCVFIILFYNAFYDLNTWFRINVDYYIHNKPKIVLFGGAYQYYTNETTLENGIKVAYVYPTSQIGAVILEPNGKINSNSYASYIKSWKYL